MVGRRVLGTGLGRAALLAITLALPGAAWAQTPATDLEPEVVSRDLDGDAETETVVLFRDAEGRLVKAEADSDGDGLADMWATYSTDEEGRVSVELAIDNTGDGEPDEWRWSLNGVMTRIGRDTRGDGRPDTWSLLDAAGAVVAVHGDTDGDGQVDTWSEVAAGGRTEHTAYDTDGDGKPDRWIFFAADGSIERIENDTDGDGLADEVVRQ